MKDIAFDWRRGAGWFRVWTLIAVAWYIAAAYFLIAVADFTQTVHLNDRAEFYAERARDQHIARIRDTSDAVCLPGTFRLETSAFQTNAPRSSNNGGSMWGLVVERYARRKQSEVAEAHPVSEKYGAASVGPSSRTTFVSGRAQCEDQLADARTILATGAAVIAPFALVVLLWFAFYVMRVLSYAAKLFLRGALLIGRWVGAGFASDGDLSPSRSASAEPPGFVSEFGGGFKRALSILVSISVCAWVVYSLKSGVRGAETLETLIASAMTVVAVSIVWIGARLLKGLGSANHDT